MKELEWKSIDSCPWMKTVWVKNKLMEKPVLATRGYVSKGGVNPDPSLFTTVYTPDGYFPVPYGNLCCPTVWAEYTEDGGD